MENLPLIEIDSKTFLRQHCTLPALPQVVHEIQKMIQSDNIQMGKIVEHISGDPGLVAQILKVVNSSYYSLPREVAEVQFAITFLGLNEVYRMVLSLSVINTIGVTEKNELNSFWYHSFYTAICTKHLAKKFEQHLSFEELWSAAILHDIGKLVYLKFFPKHYQAIKSCQEEQGITFSEAEEKLSVPASAYLGTLLCDHWRLPIKIRDACESHTLQDLKNIKSDTASAAFVRMICIGNLVSVLSTSALHEDVKHELASAIQTSLGCAEEEFLAIMAEIYDLKIDVERFMSQFM